MDPASEKAQCKVKVHQFFTNIQEEKIYFYILNLKDSFLLWIGKSPKLENLAMAMMTKFVSEKIEFCLTLKIVIYFLL